MPIASDCAVLHADVQLRGRVGAHEHRRDARARCPRSLQRRDALAQLLLDLGRRGAAVELLRDHYCCEPRVERERRGQRGDARAQRLDVGAGQQRERDDVGDLGELGVAEAAGRERRACRCAGPRSPSAGAGRSARRCG